jgi:hypothetical protein
MVFPRRFLPGEGADASTSTMTPDLTLMSFVVGVRALVHSAAGAVIQGEAELKTAT